MESIRRRQCESQLDTSSLIPISSDMVDKSDEQTVEEETQVEQTSAASLAWVLDTCAEAVVELTDAEDFADGCIAAGPAHHAQLMTGGATRVLLRANRSLVITQATGPTTRGRGIFASAASAGPARSTRSPASATRTTSPRSTRAA